MSASRRQHGRLLAAAVFCVLVLIGAVTLALHDTGGGLLPPLPEPVASRRAPSQPQASAARGEPDLALAAPGAASLAGPAASVLRRFARDWANRNSVLTAAAKREMVGLSAGAWAAAVFRQARLSLPAIAGIRAEGRPLMMKLTTVGPLSKTGLVVTRERLLDPAGELSAPRYALYLARLDRVSRHGYAITAWEAQQ